MNIEYNTMTLLCKERAGFAWLFHYKDHMKDTSRIEPEEIQDGTRRHAL
jgi:hypothetical protein